jgi:hypothetical protein
MSTSAQQQPSEHFQGREQLQGRQQPSSSTVPEVRNLNVDPYLSMTSYQPKGSALRLKDNTEFYASGNAKSKNGIIIIPDMYGWNGGRVRNICDFFGDNGTFCVIPNFSSRGVEGESKFLFFVFFHH